jgi:hypothetical protein
MDEHLPLADIPVGFFEYRTTFKEPLFWHESNQTVVREMYKVLLPWGVDLEKITWNANPRNMKEVQFTFAVPAPSVLVSIGIGGLTIIANKANWSQAAELSALFHTVVEGVKKIGNTDLESHQTVLGFHLKPGHKSFRDVLLQFLDAKALGQPDASMLAVGFYSADHSVIIDNSAVIPDAVFVKITRVFKAATALKKWHLYCGKTKKACSTVWDLGRNNDTDRAFWRIVGSTTLRPFGRLIAQSRTLLWVTGESSDADSDSQRGIQGRRTVAMGDVEQAIWCGPS